MIKSPEDSSSPEGRHRLFSAKELVQEWLAISDLWLQPDPQVRDEPHLRWLEAELAQDLEAAAAAGVFGEEDKIRLRETFGQGSRPAADPEVAARIQQIIESL